MGLKVALITKTFCTSCCLTLVYKNTRLHYIIYALNIEWGKMSLLDVIYPKLLFEHIEKSVN